MELKPSQKPRRSQDAHAAILRAAAEVAAARGYFGASIEDIARQAGVGKQTIYRWWGGKFLLFIEAYQALVPAEALAVDTGAVRADLQVLLRRLFQLYRTTPAARILAGLIAEAQADPDLAATLKTQLIDSRRSLLAAPLERGHRRGEIAVAKAVPLLVELFVAAIWYRLLVQGGAGEDRFDEEAADSLIDTLLGP